MKRRLDILIEKNNFQFSIKLYIVGSHKYFLGDVALGTPAHHSLFK